MLRISMPVISTITAIRMILIRFEDSQANIKITSFHSSGSAVSGFDTLTALPYGEKGEEVSFYGKLLRFLVGFEKLPQ